MKVLISGFEASDDTSKKTGNVYSIGKLYALIPLMGRNVEGKFICKGSMGSEYQVETALVKKIAHIPLPFEAELVIQDVMRYGKRESVVVEVQPLARVVTPVASGRSVAAAA